MDASFKWEYDVEPSNKEGLVVNIDISSNNKQNLKFVQYLYNKRVNEIEFLTDCLANIIFNTDGEEI